MTRKRRRWLAAALVVGLVVAVAAGWFDRTSSLSREEAAAAVDERIHATHRGVFPHAELEQLALLSVPCPFWSNSNRRYRLEHDYWVRGVPADQRVRVIGAVRDRWLAQGYRLRRTYDDPAGQLNGVVVHGRGGFGLSMWRSPNGDMAISGSSPCMYREAATPGDPDASGMFGRGQHGQTPYWKKGANYGQETP